MKSNSFSCLFAIILVVMPAAYSDVSDALPEKDLNTLQLVQVIFRHGNRTPLPSASFPTDQYKNETYYPYGVGQLNFEGKVRAYELGLEIRTRYNGFLPETYYPPDIKATASNTSRTQMSLQSVLTAMYPPVWPNIYLPYLQWQPISYDIVPTATDKILDTPTSCLAMKNVTTSLNDPDVRNLYSYVEKHTGKLIKSSFDMHDIYDTLLTEKQNGKVLPSWADEIMNNGTLEQAAMTYWQDLIEQKLEIGVGGLLKRINQDFQYATEPDYTTKIILYSGHDANIVLLLGALNLYEMLPIEYTSHIYFELHKINDEFGVRVFYKNGPLNLLEQLTFGKCQSEIMCPLNDFIGSVQHLYEPEPTCE